MGRTSDFIPEAIMTHHRLGKTGKMYSLPSTEDYPPKKYWIDGGGQPHKIKDMATDHLVNAATKVLQTQLRQELKLDAKRYMYEPYPYTSDEARTVYASMHHELEKRKAR